MIKEPHSIISEYISLNMIQNNRDCNYLYYRPITFLYKGSLNYYCSVIRCAFCVTSYKIFFYFVIYLLPFIHLSICLFIYFYSFLLSFLRGSGGFGVEVLRWFLFSYRICMFCLYRVKNISVTWCLLIVNNIEY